MADVLLLVVIAANEALHGGRERRTLRGIAEDLEIDGGEVMVGVGIELALVFSFGKDVDLGSGGVGIGLVAGEAVDGGILGFESAEHVVEGAVLHHENDDMLEVFDSGFGSVWSHSRDLAGFVKLSMLGWRRACLQKSQGKAVILLLCWCRNRSRCRYLRWFCASEEIGRRSNSERERVDNSGKVKRRRRVWGWIAISALIAVIVLAVIGEVVMHRAEPILKGRVIETLSTRFRSRVELDKFQVSVLRGLEVSGDGLRIFPPDDVVAAGATKPLLSFAHFSFHAAWGGLFIKPMHVGTVHVSGMAINIPPREMRQQGHGPEAEGGKDQDCGG